LNKRHNELI
jgi:tetratricopeptide (TPR) repeat protein